MDSARQAPPAGHIGREATKRVSAWFSAQRAGWCPLRGCAVRAANTQPGIARDDL
jgi:hypothetical protein